jgi:hypothetical protein
MSARGNRAGRRAPDDHVGVGTPPNERTNASTRGSIDPSKPNAVP